LNEYQIHKAAGIIIQDRKLLVERSRGREFFIAPGGQVESDETPKQALVRELKEEFNIDVREKDLEPFGTFYADAAERKNVRLREDVYFVKFWQGKITASNEVEETAWLTSKIPKGMKVGSTFHDEVIPRLKQQELID
jgi:8-oxo-dGTP diphosphatase